MPRALFQTGEKIEDPFQVFTVAIGIVGCIGTEVEVFLNGQGAENASSFRYLGDAAGDDSVGGQLVNGLPFELDFALGGFDQAADGHQSRGFSGTVGA